MNKTTEAVDCGDIFVGCSKPPKVRRYGAQPGAYRKTHILFNQTPRRAQKTGKALCGKMSVTIGKMKYTRQMLLDPSPLLCEECRQHATRILEGE